MAKQRKLPPGMRQVGRVYYAWFRCGGRQVRKRLSTDFRVACEMLADLKLKAYRRDAGQLDNDYPLADLAKDWLAQCEQTLRPSSVTRYRQNLANLQRLLPARKVEQLTVQAITVYRADRLAQGAAPRTVNMEVAALSTMLTWGVDHQLIGANPVAKIKPLPSDEKRKQRRSLTVEEVLALFGASPEHLRQAWRMFMTTGMREGELANLVFDDVDFDRRCATVHERTAKSHRCREIPLDDEMLETIRRLRDEAPFRQPMPGRSTPETVSKGHVFVSGANTPWRGVNLIKRFYRCCRLAGIEDGCRGGSVDIHSLRVSFITLSLQHGGNPKDVQEIVGHATSKMTMDVYAKATERGKRAAINALPFAKASDPAHVISLSAVQSMCKGGGAVEPQVKSAKGLG